MPLTDRILHFVPDSVKRKFEIYIIILKEVNMNV